MFEYLEVNRYWSLTDTRGRYGGS